MSSVTRRAFAQTPKSRTALFADVDVAPYARTVSRVTSTSTWFSDGSSPWKLLRVAATPLRSTVDTIRLAALASEDVRTTLEVDRAANANALAFGFSRARRANAADRARTSCSLSPIASDAHAVSRASVDSSTKASDPSGAPPGNTRSVLRFEPRAPKSVSAVVAASSTPPTRPAAFSARFCFGDPVGVESPFAATFASTHATANAPTSPTSASLTEMDSPHARNSACCFPEAAVEDISARAKRWPSSSYFSFDEGATTRKSASSPREAPTS